MFDPFKREQKNSAMVMLVVKTLAMAMEHNLPLVPVLKSLLRPGGDGCAIPKNNTRWRKRVEQMVQGLEAGQPLSTVLRQYMGKFLPIEYLDAIAAAEARNRLAEVLPVLYRCLENRRTVKGQWKSVLIYPVIQFINVFLILGGFLVFIVPRFSRIFDEMLPSGGNGNYLKILVEFSRYYVQVFKVVTIVVACIVLVNVIAKIFPRWRRYRELFFLCLPWFGRQLRWWRFWELAQGMTVLTAVHGDLIQAAEWCREATRSYWLRQKLDRFITEVKTGGNWADAWERMRLGGSAHNWIIRSAASREAPAAGFCLLQDWLAEDIKRHSARVQVLVEPALILCNCLAVGTVVYCLFMCLVKLLEGVMGVNCV